MLRVRTLLANPDGCSTSPHARAYDVLEHAERKHDFLELTTRFPRQRITLFNWIAVKAYLLVHLHRLSDAAHALRQLSDRLADNFQLRYCLGFVERNLLALIDRGLSSQLSVDGATFQVLLQRLAQTESREGVLALLSPCVSYLSEHALASEHFRSDLYDTALAIESLVRPRLGADDGAPGAGQKFASLVQELKRRFVRHADERLTELSQRGGEGREQQQQQQRRWRVCELVLRKVRVQHSIGVATRKSY